MALCQKFEFQSEHIAMVIAELIRHSNIDYFDAVRDLILKLFER